MITAIDNQPISFQGTFLKGCLCDEPEECALIKEDDDIVIQFDYQPCLGDQQLASPNFEDNADWSGGTWTITPGHACFDGGFPTMLQEQSFTPSVSSVYMVKITVGPSHSSVPGSRPEFIIRFGGALDQTILMPTTGTRDIQWVVTATATAPLQFLIPASNSVGCIFKAEVYDMTPDITVTLLDDVATIGTPFAYSGSPDLFFLDGERLIINFNITDFQSDPYTPIPEGCYTIKVEDNCDNTSLESQCIKVGDHPCTLVLSACNAENNQDQRAGQNLRLSMRVIGKLTRPAYSYTVSEDRRSNGYIDRYYADRRRSMELRIDHLGEMAHRFVSSLALFDHVYIERDEYVLSAEDYDPGYADVWESHGGILIKCEPKQELARKVRCGEDDGGCQPPPNYLVLGMGPNNNYLTQEDGFKILINT